MVESQLAARLVTIAVMVGFVLARPNDTRAAEQLRPPSDTIASAIPNVLDRSAPPQKREPRLGLMIGGGIAFAVGYVVPAAAGMFLSSGASLLIPVAGPIVWMHNPKEVFDTDFGNTKPFAFVAMTVACVTQVTGLAMVAASLLWPREFATVDPPHVMILPTGGQREPGITLAAQF